MDDNKPDAVIHCAAKVGGVKANRDNPVAFMQDNLSINSNVINAAAKAGVKTLISMGTSCMYPADAFPPIRETSLFTGWLEPSVESYALAKIAAYGLCRAYNAERGLRYVTVCPCNLYGPNDNYGPSAHVIPALIKKFQEAHGTGDVRVWGNGDAVREFLHVDDAAAAIEQVLIGETIHDLYNIGTGRRTSIREIVDNLAFISRHSGKVIWDTNEPVGIQSKTFDISRITELGWEPKIKLEYGLLDTWTQYLQTPNQRNK